MADSNLPNLSELAETPADGDELYVVDVSDTTDGATGTNKKVTKANLVGGLASETHATQHQAGGADAIKLDDLATPDDNTDLNATASAHGLLPKLSNDSSQFLNGQGSFTTPSVGASTSVQVTVYNQTGATLSQGKAVYIDGWKTGNEVPTVALARSDSATTMPALGLVASDISNSSEGTVQVVGSITLDTSAYSLDDALYVDPSTAGDLTTTKPVGANFIQSVARVTRANVSGRLYVAGALRSNDIPNFTAADKFWYGGTAGVSTEGDITAAGRALLDDASATAQIATLGLDADIATLSLPASTTISAFGATVIDDADAATARTTLGAGTLDNVVEDTTPQLGGQLDVNGNAIGDGTNELLTFTEDASAVNHVNIENEATGSPPIISAAGDDTNIGLNITGKGTGNVKIGNYEFDTDQTVGAGQDNYILTYDNGGGLISLEAAAGGGQTLYDAVLAPSGGDYTDFSTAVAALSAGDSMFISGDTFSETGGVTISTNNLTFVGANRETSIIDLNSATGSTFSGDNLVFKNLQILMQSSGDLTITGNNITMENCKIVLSGSALVNAFYPQTGEGFTMLNCRVEDSMNAEARVYRFAQANQRIIGNEFVTTNGGDSASYGRYQFTGFGSLMVDNVFDCTGGTAVTNAALVSVNDGVFKGNYIDGGDNAQAMGLLLNTGAASGNKIYNVLTGIQTAGNSMIAGNWIQTTSSTSTAVCIKASSGSNNAISGNYLQNGNTGSQIGVDLSTTDNNAISGNAFVNNVTGVNIDATGTQNVIIGNSFFGSTTDISDSGSNNIHIAATDSDPLNTT